MIAWFRRLLVAMVRMPEVPSPPFKASKRCGKLMYGLWYGRLSPDQARQQGRAWGFPEASLDRMIEDATKAPSYWSRHTNDRST